MRFKMKDYTSGPLWYRILFQVKVNQDSLACAKQEGSILSPNSSSRLSLSLTRVPATKRQKGKTKRGFSPPGKKEGKKEGKGRVVW